MYSGNRSRQVLPQPPPHPQLPLPLPPCSTPFRCLSPAYLPAPPPPHPVPLRCSASKYLTISPNSTRNHESSLDRRSVPKTLGCRPDATSPNPHSRYNQEPPSAAGLAQTSLPSAPQRFQYPLPPLRAPDVQLPATCLVQAPSPSNTYIWVFAIGRPMGTRSAPSSPTHLCTLLQMVTSVGPYSLKRLTSGKCVMCSLSTTDVHSSYNNNRPSQCGLHHRKRKDCSRSLYIVA